MKRHWKEEELVACWLLLPGEQEIIGNKRGVTRLGFVLLLKFFQLKGRFPSGPQEIPADAVRFVARQVGVDPSIWQDYPWKGRSADYHRASIRKNLGFREATVDDNEALKSWLLEDDVLNNEYRMERLLGAILDRYRTLHIEPPTDKQIHRLLRAALQEHETAFCDYIYKRHDNNTLKRLDNLLVVKSSGEDKAEWTVWQSLKIAPGRAGVDSVKKAATRLNLLREIGLPTELFKDVPPKLMDRYAKRAAVEEPFELRRHAGPLKATLLSAFLHRKREDLTDQLVDLLVETVHKMGRKAERRIDAGLRGALEKAAGKMAKLYRMAKAAVDEPKGIIEEIIFPAVRTPA